MSKATLQDSVAAKIKALYEISQELEALFPGGTIRRMAI